MKITNIEPIGIRCPEPNDNDSIRHTMLARVETDEGFVGWGEGIAMWPEAVRAAAAVVEHGLAPLLLGDDPTETEAVWQKMKRHVWWYGEGGIASFAVSAIDMAMWDIKGKSLGVPLYKLFGGKVREKLPACASIHVKHHAHADNVREICGYMDEGYRSVKAGFGKKGGATLGQDAEYDTEFVRQVRRAIGERPDMMLDIGNAVRWDVAHAIRMTRRFEEFGIRWIEEPFHPSHMQAHRELRAAVSTPIATGEREWTVDGYARLIDSGIVDIVGIDPARAEGITGFRKTIALAAAAKRAFNAHAWSTALTTAASVHLSVSAPEALLMELKPLANPMQDELADNPVKHRDGWVFPPEEPGLGVRVNEEAVRKYRWLL